VRREETIPSAVIPQYRNKASSTPELLQNRRLLFHGSGGSLFGIQIVNIFLTIITLGIYYVWAKVKVRRYLMSETEFEGDRFAYHGTGRELLNGSFKAGFILGGLSALTKSTPYLPGGTSTKTSVIVFFYIALLMLVPIAMVGSRRYRLSRTSWRGIRFSFRGRAWDFVKLFVGQGLLTLITLGLYSPSFDTNRHAFMVSHSYFGNRKFDFDGRGRDLFDSFLLALLLTIPTLYLCWFWYWAKKQRYFWDHTSFGTARFRSTMTGRHLFSQKLGNLLLLVGTLGFAWPWVMVRTVQFNLAYLTLEGRLDLAAIQQEAQTASATGEELDSLMDLDTGFAA
jgi:uncharacterized membrane protein YjgN (DUF898 family)